MKLDRTLIDKDGIPTREEIRAYHEKNDITTAESLYDPETASDIKTRLFTKARNYMRDAWLAEMKRLGGKGSFTNFTGNYPPMLLAVTDENLIAGKVSDIMQNEEEIAMYLDVGLNILEEPIMTALTAYSSSKGKYLENLTDDEVHTVVDKIATEFLMKMTSILMDAQKVPELIKTSKEISDSEDFDESVIENYSKMDHDKAWNHTRSSVGEILSTDELTDDPESEFEPTANALDNTESGEEAMLNEIAKGEQKELIKKFLKTLHKIDRKIFILRELGFVEDEIACYVDLSSHSSVSKRLSKIRVKYDEFMKKYNGA